MVGRFRRRFGARRAERQSAAERRSAAARTAQRHGQHLAERDRRRAELRRTGWAKAGRRFDSLREHNRFAVP
jgi:hypothetical protein